MSGTIKVPWPGWNVVRRIGGGSFGQVYEMERDVFGQKEHAALKIIKVPQEQDEVQTFLQSGYTKENVQNRLKSDLEDIAKEYLLMAELKGNANIVHCEDIFSEPQEDGLGWVLYLRMELLKPLYSVLQVSANEKQIAKIGMDLCRALISCEEKNIIHRDIKPSNILVSSDGNYKLGDFGIAKTASRTAGGTKTGTYEFMAPEVYNNKPYNKQVDIYSLGMVLYTLLNRRCGPFLPMPPEIPTATQATEAMQRRFSGEALPAPADGSQAMKQVVLKACAFDPADRYASAQEFYQALAAAANSSQTAISQNKDSGELPADFGTDSGTVSGTVTGTVSGTDSGTVTGTVTGTDSGTVTGTVTGTDSGTVTGTVSGIDSGTVSGNESDSISDSNGSAGTSDPGNIPADSGTIGNSWESGSGTIGGAAPNGPEILEGGTVAVTDIAQEKDTDSEIRFGPGKKRFKPAYAIAAIVVLILCVVFGPKIMGTKPAAQSKPQVSSGEQKKTPTNPAPTVKKSDASVAPEKLDPVTLSIMLHGSAVDPQESRVVMDELNKYLKEKINVTLKPVWENWGSFDTSATNALHNGDPIDILFTSQWSANEYNTYAKNGYYVMLDDLLAEYAPGLLKEIPKASLICATIDGYYGKGFYAVPTLSEPGRNPSWMVNATILGELGFSSEDITNYYPDYFSPEFEELLAKSKALKGSNFYPLAIMPDSLERMIGSTAILDGGPYSISVLSYPFDSSSPSHDSGAKLECRFDTPFFKKFVEKTYEYAQKGYIAPQCQESADSAKNYCDEVKNNGNYLFTQEEYTVNFTFYRPFTYEPYAYLMSSSYADSFLAENSMLAISSASENVERAAMFLELLYTDPKVMTMLTYGLEGRQYNKNADGTIQFNSEYQDKYTTWWAGMGNNWLLPPTEYEGADMQKTRRDFYSNLSYLPIKGFAVEFNDAFSTPYKKVRAVCDQYAFSLMSGKMDPAANLPAFQQKLKDAGVSNVVAEGQRQLDEYMK